MASSTPNATVQVGIDESRRRILVWIVGNASGEVVARRISDLFRSRPELVGYDMLYDLTSYTGDIGADDLDPIVEAYAECHGDPAAPCRTAFVTFDRHFQHWATAMDEQFPGREHRAFPRLPAALQFLAEPVTIRRRGRV
jgi:hypothetical protein